MRLESGKLGSQGGQDAVELGLGGLVEGEGVVGGGGGIGGGGRGVLREEGGREGWREGGREAREGGT